MPTFAEWLGEQIGGRSLRQVAEYSGVDKSMLSLYLRSKAYPSMKTLKRLASYFNADASALAAMLPDPADAGPGPKVPVPAGNAGLHNALQAVSELTDPDIRLDLYDLVTIASAGLAPDTARQLHEALEEVKERFRL